MPAEDGPKDKKETPVDIREMEIDDIPSVFHLGERLFTSDEFPILYRTWDAYEVTDAFTADPEYCFVAEADEKIVGFVLGTTIEKEGTAWKTYGYLSWIGVDDDFQRRRLGRRLYRKLEEKLRLDGARMMLADTGEGNAEAISFFHRMGFSKQGQHVWLGKTLRKPRVTKKAQT
ncbi:MAG: GNAT family N-acetyltransferase [Dehalococcoidia bacterium]|nr:GNAT family N-acetyltransferase [Dehalococcoidia bacterium]